MYLFADDGIAAEVFAETTALPLDNASGSPDAIVNNDNARCGNMTNLTDGCREESPSQVQLFRQDLLQLFQQDLQMPVSMVEKEQS